MTGWNFLRKTDFNITAVRRASESHTRKMWRNRHSNNILINQHKVRIYTHTGGIGKGRKPKT
jgi:hypothetical protein